MNGGSWVRGTHERVGVRATGARAAGALGITLASLLAAACSFDPAGIAGASSAGPGVPDAAVASPGTPDARPLPPPPDARPVDRPGEVRALTLPPGVSITLDGDLGDWPADADWKSFSAASAGSTMDRFAPSYTASIDATFALLRAPQSVLLGVRVNDDVLTNDSTNYWDDDSIEAYFTFTGDADGPYGASDHVFWFRTDGSCGEYGLATSSLVTCQVQKSGTSWVVEARIDLPTGVAVPASIGFGLALNDDDGLANSAAFSVDTAVDAYVPWFVSGRASCASCCPVSAYAPHPQPWCDTTRLGTLRFDP